MLPGTPLTEGFKRAQHLFKLECRAYEDYSAIYLPPLNDKTLLNKACTCPFDNIERIMTRYPVDEPLEID